VKRGRNVYIRREGLKEIKGKTSQTQIIQGIAKEREVLGGRDNR
jgi:hypothetical protein